MASRIGLIWAQELEWHILVPICLFGMSYALLHGEHVRVDVLFQSFSPRTKHAVDVAAAILGMAAVVLVIWLSIHYVMQSWYDRVKARPIPAASTTATSSNR